MLEINHSELQVKTVHKDEDLNNTIFFAMYLYLHDKLVVQNTI